MQLATEVQDYSADYSASQVKSLIRKLQESQSLTLFAPSGFGKTKLLKFLAYNHKYQRRYRELHNVRFVYIDMNEYAAEASIDASAVLPSAENFKLNRLLYILTRNLISANLQTTSQLEIEREYSHLAAEGSDPKLNLYIYLDKMIAMRRDVIAYLTLDNVEAILKPGFEDSTEFIVSLRERYKSHLNLIFAIPDAHLFEPSHVDRWAGLKNLALQSVFPLPLPTVSETYQMSVLLPQFKPLRWIIQRSPKYKAKVARIQELTGGYPVYTKKLGLLSLEGLANIPSTWELDLASQRLLGSLTVKQFQILNSISQNRDVAESRDLGLLLALKLVSKEGTKYKLFSPIMSTFLKSSREG